MKKVFTWLWFSALLEVRIIFRTGFLCCVDFLPFLCHVPWVYGLHDVKRLQMSQVGLSLCKKHKACALDVQSQGL